MKNNISLSTALPWWPDKAERKICEIAYLLPVPGYRFGSVFCKFNCRLVRVLFPNN